MSTIIKSKKVKIIASLLPIGIIVGGLIYLQLRGNRISRSFYKVSVNSVVIESSDWQKRSIDFYLDNKMTLNFLVPVETRIMVGDSIRKAPNTYLYSVYRKDINGNYNFFATYDYRKKY